MLETHLGGQHEDELLLHRHDRGAQGGAQCAGAVARQFFQLVPVLLVDEDQCRDGCQACALVLALSHEGDDR